jgi:hypothetical protein
MGHLARTREMKNAYKILIGKHEGKRPIMRLSRRYEDDIKMDIKDLGREGVNWFHLAQNRASGELL